MTTTILTGLDAIKHAEAYFLPLNKYADPIEGAREGLTVDEAREIAAEDASLIWVERAPVITKRMLEGAFADVPLGARVRSVAVTSGPPLSGTVVGVSTIRREYVLVQFDGPLYGEIRLVTVRAALELVSHTPVLGTVCEV